MSDYARIAKAIEFIAAHREQQPSLEDIARHLNLSPFHVQRLFSQWAGITPKRFLQILTVERAKPLLRGRMPLLAVADDVGLSSGSRLYDHFVQLEAVTPGEYAQKGANLSIDYGVQETPFGDAFVARTQRGLCKFVFTDASADDPLAQLQHDWPHAKFHENPDVASAITAELFQKQRAGTPLSLHVSGTNFQVNVWRALMMIPPAQQWSYSQLAEASGYPKAARAVGQAIGANPIAFIIPCHRVIQKSGALGGYRWGVTRKRAMLAWESAVQARDE